MMEKKEAFMEKEYIRSTEEKKRKRNRWIFLNRHTGGIVKRELES